MKDEAQPEHLERVTVRIGKSVVKFCEARVGQEFHADELRNHVMAECEQVAPNSPYRILYELRRKGELDYEVVSRRESKYRVLRVGQEQFTGELF